MTKAVKTDAYKAIGFLMWLDPDAPLYLEKLESRGPAKPRSKTYQPHEADSAKRFVAQNNSEDYRRNIHYLLNAPYLKGSPAKANVSASGYVWVDLDMKDYPGDEAAQHEAILGPLTDAKLRPKSIPDPTAILFTGGGYQAIWKLTAPVDIEEAEALNRALLVAFGGAPGPVDASRLLRLPETVNWLSDTKREQGREPASAYLLEPANFRKSPVTYALEDFKVKRPKDTSNKLTVAGRDIAEETSLAPLPLPEDLSEILPSNPDWGRAIAIGENPPGKAYPSRSELVFAALRWMLGGGTDPAHALAILLDENYGIGAHVRDQPNPLRYAQRQVSRALLTLEAKQEDWPHLTEKGNPVEGHPANIRYALARLGVDAQRNKFSEKDEVSGLNLENRDLNDIGDILASRFRLELHFKASSAAIKSEIVAIAHEQSYHPVIDYLDAQEWDGIPRLDTWLPKYCGAEDTELNREFGAKFLIAGVRRVKHPGTKFDQMLVLEGRQGTGKSSLAVQSRHLVD